MKTLFSIIIKFDYHIQKLNGNKPYKILLFSVILFSSLISYKNITFDLYFNSVYGEYAAFFKSFDFNSFTIPGITFPMWGYGFIHLLGKNIPLILFIQQALTFYSLLFLDDVVNRYNLIKRIDIFRLSILLSMPWFLFHTQMWPKSIASNLILLGVLLLIDFFKTGKTSKLLISSILFGILHNFRPDYFYLSIVLYFITICFSKKRNYKTFIFPIVQYILLVPWMVFTFYQTGKVIPTSTNAGHVLFIGLGQLPNNIWGITPFDEDPIKVKVLTEEFGPYFKSDNHKEDEFLKNKFQEYIKHNPVEWMKKCFFAFRLLTLDPFYVGNVGDFQKNGISNIKEIRKLENYFYQMNFKESLLIIRNTNWDFSFKEILQLLVTIYAKIYGILIFISFLFLTIMSFFNINELKRFELIDVILLIIIGYQMSISIFAFHMPVYNTTIFIFYLLMTNRLFQKYLSIKQ